MLVPSSFGNVNRTLPVRCVATAATSAILPSNSARAVDDTSQNRRHTAMGAMRCAVSIAVAVAMSRVTVALPVTPAYDYPTALASSMLFYEVP